MAICHMWQVSFGLNNAVLNAYVDLRQTKQKYAEQNQRNENLKILFQSKMRAQHAVHQIIVVKFI